MRILVISDVHANITALDAVLENAVSIDAVWCLGDLVGYGPDPNESIRRIREIPNLVCLLGNHDAAALGRIDLESFNREARISAEWMRSKITADNLDYLRSLPERVEINEVTLTHGSPRNPVWEYLLDIYTARESFKHFQTPFCFVGHTHLPVAYLQQANGDAQFRVLTHVNEIKLIDKAILNPGSVGQPRDHDPRAAFAIFDTEEKIWRPQRVVYDISSVQDRISSAGLPYRHAMRLVQGW